MKFNLKLIIIFIVSMTFGCQTEVDRFDPEIFDAPGDYHDALHIVQDKNQVIEIIAEEANLIELSKSNIQLEAHAFVSAESDEIFGEIELSILELYHHRDLLKYDISTVDESNQLLNPKVLLRLTASQNGQPLQLNPNVSEPLILVADDILNEASLYSQDGSGEMWQLNQGQAISGNLFIQLGGIQKDTTGYQFALPALGWIGLQRELTITNQTDLCLKLLDSNTPTNTVAFVIFDHTNAIKKLNLSSAAKCASTFVPLEFQGTLVVMSHKGVIEDQEHIEVSSHRVMPSSMVTRIDLTPDFVFREDLIAFVQQF